MSSIQHQQLILRVPEELSERIHAILNTENGQMNIFITPIERHVDHYEFKLNDEVYPALLQNLPCLLESHKTVDMKIFYKSGDIGQILCVYPDESARDSALLEQKKLDEVKYMPHGLTPPAESIIKKKYSKTREKKAHSFERIQFVLEQIRSFDAKEKERREVIEEVVDFEEWMVDKSSGTEGIKLRFEGERWLQTSGDILLQHPEILEVRAGEEEEKDVKDVNKRKSQAKGAGERDDSVEPLPEKGISRVEVAVAESANDEPMEVEEEPEIEEENEEESDDDDWLNEMNTGGELKEASEEVEAAEIAVGPSLAQPPEAVVVDEEKAEPEDSDSDDDDAWLKEIETRD